ncbi:MAG: MMPL family transporter [Gaiellaceae bacterium]
MLGRLATIVYRRRRWVLVAWALLTAFGAFSAKQVSSRWFESFSIPGYSAYETNQKTLKVFGSGEQAPLVLVFRSPRDVTKAGGVARAIDAAAAQNPRSRVSSYFSTHDDAYVSRDRHTTFAELYPAGTPGFGAASYLGRTRAAVKAATPSGVRSWMTGRDPLQEDSSGGNGPSVLTEAVIGGFGALIILMFVFGTLPAVVMPLVIALAAILNTFSLVWALTYLTNVSIIVQFLIALVGLGVAIDYALLMIFRFREELASGEDVETAVVETMRHAGRSVIVSGSTVAVGLLSMIVLPLPFIRSIGIGGMLIPAVSVIAAITLLPALLSVLGHRINRVRVMPKRVVAVTDGESGFWARWARLVIRRPVVVAAIGLVIVGILVSFGLRINPSEAQAKDQPGAGDAVAGRQALAAAGISAGAFKPFAVLTRAADAETVAQKLRSLDGIDGASAPAAWRRAGYAIVEAIPAGDGASKPVRTTITRVRDALPPGASLGGVAPEDRDFVHAVYGNFPYVLLFVIVLTYILLARAFRSLILPLKAVILNLVSLAAAFGIIVFIFQWGHGAHLIWGVHATQSIIPWIPLMIFAFLFGLSMDYEVFMLTRMREVYDDTGRTNDAIELGLARTGKLVTSAALVLCLAFFVLSTGPGLDIKQFGIGLAAGIIFDATVIRALLVPAILRLLGRWNWWLPSWAARPLRTRASDAAPDAAPLPESA